MSGSELNLVKKAKENNELIKRLKGENEFTAQLLDENRFMKNINSLEDFKKKIMSIHFWGETWAISTLERLLNMKLIILSREYYNARDLHNVVQCGQLNDAILQKKGEFKPKYYIIADYSGNHYQNIAYKGKKILTFEEIPYGIRKKIIDKCLEKNAGPYYIIPKFVAEKKKLNAMTDKEREDYLRSEVDPLMDEGGML